MRVQNKVSGVVLAGGLARRMQQQDKGLLIYKNRPLVCYALQAMAGVAEPVFISANRNAEQYRAFGYRVIADETLGFNGPLAGIQSALRITRTPVLLVAPCDTPLIEAAHLELLLNKLEENDADIVVPFDGERIHPAFMALKTSLLSSLDLYLHQGNRRIDEWLPWHNWIKADFSGDPGVFVNVNTPSELAELERGEFIKPVF